MNNLPRQALRRIVDKYGKEICSDARRCEGLLNDLCGAYRREVNVLVVAVEEHVPLDLLARAGSMSPELLLTRLEKRLEEHTALTAEAARWSVESWALALGVITDAEIAEKEQKRKTVIPPENKATPQLTRVENNPAKTGTADFNPTNSGQPSKSPVSQQKNSPPLPQLNRQQINIPSAAPPPVRQPVNNQPQLQPPTANQQIQSPKIQSPNPAAISKSRFSLFRGCLIVVFLLALSSIALFLGVPYAIEVMRETQRERNNDPPRFPTR
jgi:hypothetical protein